MKIQISQILIFLALPGGSISSTSSFSIQNHISLLQYIIAPITQYCTNVSVTTTDKHLSFICFRAAVTFSTLTRSAGHRFTYNMHHAHCSSHSVESPHTVFTSHYSLSIKLKFQSTPFL